MQIWAHTLVKNEVKWLWYSVTSVIDYVDRLLLWDTGSIDGSIEIARELKERYPKKVFLRERKQTTAEEFTSVRQEMLDTTDSDWFLMVDGDEIWYRDSIKKVVDQIKKEEKIESIIVPTINLIGDIFHYQEKQAGMYRFGNLAGHYNLRAIKKDIPGLHSQGVHGVWGWADGEGKMIQDRETYKFVDGPYIHATNLPRSTSDSDVLKRKKKLRFEIGNDFPKDFFYPEVFFKDRPDFIPSPWYTMSKPFTFRAFFETPLRKIKRRLVKKKIGY